MRPGRALLLLVLLAVLVLGVLEGTSPLRTRRALEPVAWSAASAAADAYFASGGSEDQAALAAGRRVEELDAALVSFLIEPGGSVRVTVGRSAPSHVATRLGVPALSRRYEVQATAVAMPRAGAPPAGTGTSNPSVP